MKKFVELKEGTRIQGNVVVESENGEIWLSSQSEIYGDVTGAKVIRK